MNNLQKLDWNSASLGLIGALLALPVIIFALVAVFGGEHKTAAIAEPSPYAIKPVAIAPVREPSERERAIAIKEEVQRSLVLTDWTWKKDAFGTVAMADFTLGNESMWDVQDIKLRVVFRGKSGSMISSDYPVIYDVLQADQTRLFKEINCGFVASQAISASVSIEDCRIGNQRFSEPKSVRVNAEYERQGKLASDRARAAFETRTKTASETDARLLTWHQEQAAKGIPSAQCSLGLRYLRGDGVPKDETLARAWLQKAASQGNLEAKSALSILKN